MAHDDRILAMTRRLQLMSVPMAAHGGPRLLRGKRGADGKDGASGADGNDGARGIDGASGHDGRDGVKGLDGVAGRDGLDGRDGSAGMAYRGQYSQGIAYAVGDVVTLAGSSYICVAPTEQAPPIGAGWEILAARGDRGASGFRGADGAPGTTDASALTGATLASNVTASGLSSIGSSSIVAPTGTTATGSGIIVASYFALVREAKALSNATGLQDIFDDANNQIALVADTSYFVEMELVLNTGTTSHTNSIVLTEDVTLRYDAARFTTMATYPTAVGSVQRSQDFAVYSSQVLTACTGAITSAYTMIRVNGLLHVGDAGFMTPQVSFSVAPGGTNTVQPGTWIRLHAVGASAVQQQGPWS